MEIQRQDNLISCDYIQYGDYDNSCAVERANVRYLENKNLVEYTERGSYGYIKAWLLGTPENEELLNSLEDYPCFDDELVSEIEREIEDQYLDDCRQDLHKLLSYNDILQDVLFIDFDRECYEKAKELSNEYFIVEAGGNGWIDFERIAKDYSLLLCDKYPAIKTLAAAQEVANNEPAFPDTFYVSAQDCLDHNRLNLTQEQIDLLNYTAELETLIYNLKRGLSL